MVGAVCHLASDTSAGKKTNGLHSEGWPRCERTRGSVRVCGVVSPRRGAGSLPLGVRRVCARGACEKRAMKPFEYDNFEHPRKQTCARVRVITPLFLFQEDPRTQVSGL